MVRLSVKVPERILAALHWWDRSAMDVHAVDLLNRCRHAGGPEPRRCGDWVGTDDLTVRGASAQLPSGSSEVRVRGGEGGAWRVLARVPFGEDVILVDLSGDGKTAFIQRSGGSGTIRGGALDAATGKEQVVAANPKVDASTVQVYPTRHVIEAVDFPATRQAWTVDPAVKADFEGLKALARGKT